MSISNGNGGMDVGMVCSDASIAIGKIVYGDTTDTTNSQKVVTVATADTHVPIGVTMTATTAADEQVTIRVSGIADVVVNGTNAIDIGDKIVASAAGVGVIVTTTDAVVQEVLGIALAPSTANGDRISVLIARQSLVKGTA